MGITTGHRPHAEFMRVWEEGYVGTRGMFEAMHMQGVGIFEGGDLRHADGSLNRESIRDWVSVATRGVPYAHLRLMRSPFGLTSPAWVPDDDFDLDRHIRFTDVAADLSPGSLRSLIGWDAGSLDPHRPLWRLQFTPLVDGRVALGVLMHHSGGDALRTLKFLATLTTSKPDGRPAPSESVFAHARAPRRGGELLVLAVRDWAASDTGAVQLWKDYWRRSPARRARRVAGRLVRPLRDIRARRRPAARPLTAAYRTIADTVVHERADAVGGTMNDLVVASVIRTASSDGRPVRVRVPVLRRRTEDSRNRVTDVPVVGSSDQTPNELVASVRDQLRVETDTEQEIPPGPARDIGYVTLVPWLSRPRHLCGARLEDMIVLPAALPTDELSTFALLYDNRLSVVTSAAPGRNLESVMSRLVTELGGRADA